MHRSWVSETHGGKGALHGISDAQIKDLENSCSPTGAQSSFANANVAHIGTARVSINKFSSPHSVETIPKKHPRSKLATGSCSHIRNAPRVRLSDSRRFKSSAILEVREDFLSRCTHIVSARKKRFTGASA